jgi:hypothetical protein
MVWRLALPVWAIARVDQIQESGSAGVEMRGGIGLGSVIVTTGERRGDPEGPQQSCISGSSSVMPSSDRAAGNEDQQVNREVAEDEQRDRRAGQDTGAQRHNAHHARERGSINLVGHLVERPAYAGN